MSGSWAGAGAQMGLPARLIHARLRMPVSPSGRCERLLTATRSSSRLGSSVRPVGRDCSLLKEACNAELGGCLQPGQAGG